MRQLSARALAEWLADGERSKPLLLDVREAHEWNIGHLAGAQHMPMHSVPGRMGELARDADIVCICHHGGRSAQVAMFLKQQGYSKIYNLAGGVDAWACEIDPAMPRY
ncbi:MAG: sulfurtransferase [Rhodocyclaceae bacterium]|nr:sulfurtransferase [Rhodocyclaceae bacterium]MBX3669150.1 sulfurtransferase [Rhodocyclaceae bacterium]